MAACKKSLKIIERYIKTLEGYLYASAGLPAGIPSESRADGDVFLDINAYFSACAHERDLFVDRIRCRRSECAIRRISIVSVKSAVETDIDRSHADPRIPAGM